MFRRLFMHKIENRMLKYMGQKLKLGHKRTQTDKIGQRVMRR